VPESRKDEMKKLINFLKKMQPRTTTYYYHGQVLTDELEREMMKAYMGVGFRGKRF
jgi:hypothetical protein